MTSASSDAPKLGPVQSQERIVLLDVLRAFAILGMFYSNFGGGFSPPTVGNVGVGGFQEAISDAVFMLVVGRFWPLFAILMGVGMAVQVERADARGIDIFPVHLRRLFFLYLLGEVLGLVINVGQLPFLAVSGLVALFIAFPIRRRRSLLLVIIIWMFLGETIPAAIGAHGRPNAEQYTAEEIEERFQRSEERYLSSVENAGRIASPFRSFEDIRSRLDRYAEDGVPGEFRSINRLLSFSQGLLLFMLFGFFLWQTGIFRRSWERRRLFTWLLLISGTVGLAAALGEETLGQRSIQFRYGLAEPMTPQLFALRSVCSDVAPYALDLAYISLVALLLPTKWLGSILQKLAPAGRMAFTNYVLHRAVSPILFPLLFAWWLPETGAAENHLKVTGVFILLVLFSTWWLKRFRFGPFEWLWRSLTYWKLQPMRVERPQPVE